MKVSGLGFDAVFTEEARDFAVYVATGDANAVEGSIGIEESPFLQPLYGESCAVQTFTSQDDIDNSDSWITNNDGDTCHDVLLSPGSSLSTVFSFQNDILIPCSDYGMGDGKVKMQFCSSWRSEVEDASCDSVGPHPCSSSGCACEVVELGVKIVNEEDAVSV